MGIAVILTTHEQKAKYDALASGTEILESRYTQ